MSEKEPNNLVVPISFDVSSHELPRSSILRGKSAFEKLFRASNTFRSGSILFRYCQVPLSDPSSALPNHLQTAFIAPKRIGNAVIRNKTKRVLRETFRTSNKQLHSFLRCIQLIYIWHSLPAILMLILSSLAYICEKDLTISLRN